MEVVFSSRRNLHTAKLTTITPELGVAEGKCVVFNDLLPSARIARERELDSFKIAVFNSLEDSILLETSADQKTFACVLGG